MRACMYARMYARSYDCGQIAIRTQDQHTRGTHTTGTQDHRKKPAYIGIFADNEKKYKKIKEKFGNMEKPPYLCSRNQTTNKFNNKITKQ